MNIHNFKDYNSDSNKFSYVFAAAYNDFEPRMGLTSWYNTTNPISAQFCGIFKVDKLKKSSNNPSRAIEVFSHYANDPKKIPWGTWIFDDLKVDSIFVYLFHEY